MPAQFTLYDLTHITDFLGFEAFCHDLMSREGYRSIQPLGGYHDKGRDAIHWFESTSTSTVFAYSTRKDWNDKLQGDLRKVHEYQHPCNRFVFATNQPVSAGDFDRIKEDIEGRYGWAFELYDVNRIATLIDNEYSDLKAMHPNIFKVSSRISDPCQINSFDPKTHAAFFLGSHHRWIEQHTPLLAEHRELPTFVDMQGSQSPTTRLRVSSIPDKSTLAILLGESGAGKTSALWKIVVETCNTLASAAGTLAPVFVSLRGWTTAHKCRELFDEQLKPFDLLPSVIEHELRTGRFLILFDSLNEVSSDNRNNCRYDIARFIARHPRNSFLISCRTAEYHPELIPLDEVSPSTGKPTVYEICRLDRDQIVQYAQTYFADHSRDSRPFLDQLRIESDTVWGDRTSQVHLARIPLFLQLFLDVFRQVGVLPDSRASLLNALVSRIVERENARMDAQIERPSNDRILGYLSFQATANGYEFQFPERYAQKELASVVSLLKDTGLVAPSATIGDIWRSIVSANFLQYVSRDSVAWLHQLIRDYFLGVESARVWEIGDQEVRRDLLGRLTPRASDIACTMTLGVLGQEEGSSFLWALMQVSEPNARRAFEGQSKMHRSRVVDRLIFNTLRKNDYDTTAFNMISRILPYVEVAEGFSSHFYTSKSVEMSALLIAAISELMIEHAPTIASEGLQVPYWDAAIQEARFQTTKAAVRRCEELLRKYLRNTDEFVSFYAAKGLFEHDRPAVVAQLRNLLDSSNRQVVSLVADLIEEWGIE